MLLSKVHYRTKVNNASELFQRIANTIQTIARIAGQSSLPHLMDLILATLKNSDYSAVTRMEYEIMGFPEGELYDKSVIEGYL